jgi:hypothetical protein
MSCDEKSCHYRASSGYSRPTVTVEKRMKMGVFSPTVDKKLAFWRAISIAHAA